MPFFKGKGGAGDLQLRDGDRLIIPPIGPTIAVTGAVKRPAIYEIEQKNTGFKIQTQNKGKPLSLNEALSLSGGIISQGQYRYISRTPTPTGKENISEVSDLFTKTFTDGTILSVESSADKKAGQVELSGNTNRPGLYDLDHYKTLRDLLKNSDVLGDDIYPLLGVIKRWDKTQLATTFKSFSVRIVLDNKFDINLSEGDTVLLFNNHDISNIYRDTHKNTYRIENTKDSQIPPKNIIEINSPLEHFVKEQSVQIRGAVRAPGTYPIAKDIPLDHLLAVAGGMSSHADLEAIEITKRTANENTPKRTIINSYDQSLSDILINAGDTIRINQKREKLVTANTVKIFGEVNRPGEYDLMAGDTVLDILERAGGLSAQAYPAGSIFSRESERKSEEMRFRNAARDMQARLASAIENDKAPPNAAQIEMVSALSEQLSTIEAVGRITVETNPDILATQPELNMLLEAGDRIYIPKRPLTVRVSGEVLSPSSLQFRKEKDPIDYIREAGNFSYHADKDRTFVVYPDGSAQPLQVNTWNHKPVFIPPGSTIIVPRDPKPFDFIEGAKEISQILSNIAITSVFIDDIRD